MPNHLSGGWIVTFVLDKRGAGSGAGYVSSGFFGGLTIGRIALIWVNRKVSPGSYISRVPPLMCYTDRRATRYLHIRCDCHSVSPIYLAAPLTKLKLACFSVVLN